MHDIDKLVFLNARERLGLSREGLAKSLCLSSKHIRELEEGGVSSFFSYAHKDQVAKKVAIKLGLSEESIYQINTPLEALRYENVGVQSIEEPLIEVDVCSNNPIANEIDLGQSFSNKKKKFILKWILLANIVLSPLVVYSFFNPLWEDIDNKLLPLFRRDIATVNGVTKSQIDDVFDICDIEDSELMPVFSATTASKQGDFIYMRSKVAQEICVIDVLKNKTKLTLDPGGDYSISGRPPFIINVKKLNGLDIYYQGGKIQIPVEVNGPISLKEIPVGGFVKQ